MGDSETEEGAARGATAGTVRGQTVRWPGHPLLLLPPKLLRTVHPIITHAHGRSPLHKDGAGTLLAVLAACVISTSLRRDGTVRES